jgi:hypothetical protein
MQQYADMKREDQQDATVCRYEDRRPTKCNSMQI